MRQSILAALLGIWCLSWVGCGAPQGIDRPPMEDEDEQSMFNTPKGERRIVPRPHPGEIEVDPGLSTEGQWMAISAVLSGTPFPDQVTSSITLKLQDKSYEVVVGGNPDKGSCTVESATDPPRLTIQGTDGPNAGKTILAIYEMKDATQLRVCYDLKGQEFPKAFESTAENGYFLVSYKRAE